MGWPRSRAKVEFNSCEKAAADSNVEQTIIRASLAELILPRFRLLSWRPSVTQIGCQGEEGESCLIQETGTEGGENYVTTLWPMLAYRDCPRPRRDCQRSPQSSFLDCNQERPQCDHTSRFDYFVCSVYVSSRVQSLACLPSIST